MFYFSTKLYVIIQTNNVLDNSILTEDTDSFIIGERVWVGGTKPGQIAYIGETQFAPGEWAGVVLDQPIGKYRLAVGKHNFCAAVKDKWTV